MKVFYLEKIGQTNKKIKRSKAAVKYQRHMFMCAALSEYSRAKGYKELMFMNDFEKLLDDSKIDLNDLFEQWNTDEHILSFNNDLEIFELEEKKEIQ